MWSDHVRDRIINICMQLKIITNLGWRIGTDILIVDNNSIILEAMFSILSL